MRLTREADTQAKHEDRLPSLLAEQRGEGHIVVASQLRQIAGLSVSQADQWMSHSCCDVATLLWQRSGRL